MIMAKADQSNYAFAILLIRFTNFLKRIMAESGQFEN